jgi:hypothetical protein
VLASGVAAASAAGKRQLNSRAVKMEEGSEDENRKPFPRVTSLVLLLLAVCCLTRSLCSAFSFKAFLGASGHGVDPTPAPAPRPVTPLFDDDEDDGEISGGDTSAAADEAPAPRPITPLFGDEDDGGDHGDLNTPAAAQQAPVPLLFNAEADGLVMPMPALPTFSTTTECGGCSRLQADLIKAEQVTPEPNGCARLALLRGECNCSVDLPAQG